MVETPDKGREWPVRKQIQRVWKDLFDECTETFDERLAAGALGVRTAGTGDQRLERRPVCPSSGFDPNFPA